MNNSSWWSHAITILGQQFVIQALRPTKMRVFPDQHRLWAALVDITSEEHLPLADGSKSFYAEDEDPFADYEEKLADTLKKFFGCNEGEIVGNFAVFSNRIWASQSISDFLALHLTNER